jgi:hypothetical protein
MASPSNPRGDAGSAQPAESAASEPNFSVRESCLYCGSAAAGGGAIIAGPWSEFQRPRELPLSRVRGASYRGSAGCRVTVGARIPGGSAASGGAATNGSDAPGVEYANPSEKRLWPAGRVMTVVVGRVTRGRWWRSLRELRPSMMPPAGCTCAPSLAPPAELPHGPPPNAWDGWQRDRENRGAQRLARDIQ